MFRTLFQAGMDACKRTTANGQLLPPLSLDLCSFFLSFGAYLVACAALPVFAAVARTASDRVARAAGVLEIAINQRGINRISNTTTRIPLLLLNLHRLLLRYIIRLSHQSRQSPSRSRIFHKLRRSIVREYHLLCRRKLVEATSTLTRCLICRHGVKRRPSMLRSQQLITWRWRPCLLPILRLDTPVP